MASNKVLLTDDGPPDLIESSDDSQCKSSDCETEMLNCKCPSCEDDTAKAKPWFDLKSLDEEEHMIKICAMAPFIFNCKHVAKCGMREFFCRFKFPCSCVHESLNAIEKLEEYVKLTFEKMRGVGGVKLRAILNTVLLHCPSEGALMAYAQIISAELGYNFKSDEEKFYVMYIGVLYTEHMTSFLTKSERVLNRFFEDNSIQSAFKEKGNVHFQAGQYLSALRMYKRGLLESPLNCVLYGNCALCYLKLKRYPEAVLEGQRCMLLQPKWSKGYYRCAQAHDGLKNLKQALDVASQGIENCDQDPELLRLHEELTRRLPACSNTVVPLLDEPVPALTDSSGDEDDTAAEGGVKGSVKVTDAGAAGQKCSPQLSSPGTVSEPQTATRSSASSTSTVDTTPPLITSDDSFSEDTCNQSQQGKGQSHSSQHKTDAKSTCNGKHNKDKTGNKSGTDIPASTVYHIPVTKEKFVQIIFSGVSQNTEPCTKKDKAGTTADRSSFKECCSKSRANHGTQTKNFDDDRSPSADRPRLVASRNSSSSRYKEPVLKQQKSVKTSDDKQKTKQTMANAADNECHKRGTSSLAYQVKSTEKVTAKTAEVSSSEGPSKNSMNRVQNVGDDMNWRDCLAPGHAAYQSKQYSAAAQYFQTAILHQPKNTKDREQMALMYVLCLSLMHDDHHKSLQEALKYAQRILDEHSIKFHIFGHLGLAKCFLRQNRFSDAVKPLEAGLELLKCNMWPGVCYWPGTDVCISPSVSHLKDEFVDLLHHCQNPPTPLAICRSHIADHVNPRPEIYLDDVEFKGYMSVCCTEHCVIQYHIECWKSLKSHTNKEMLNTPCLTPDCTGTISKLCIYGLGGTVSRTWQVEKQPAEVKPVEPKPQKYTKHKEIKETRSKQQLATNQTTAKKEKETANVLEPLRRTRKEKYIFSRWRIHEKDTEEKASNADEGVKKVDDILKFGVMARKKNSMDASKCEWKEGMLKPRFNKKPVAPVEDDDGIAAVEEKKSEVDLKRKSGKEEVAKGGTKDSCAVAAKVLLAGSDKIAAPGDGGKGAEAMVAADDVGAEAGADGKVALPLDLKSFVVLHKKGQDEDEAFVAGKRKKVRHRERPKTVVIQLDQLDVDSEDEEDEYTSCLVAATDQNEVLSYDDYKYSSIPARPPSVGVHGMYSQAITRRPQLPPSEPMADVKTEIADSIFLHFSNLLERYGPVHTDDLLVSELLESFSIQAQMLILEAGGIKKFLLQSIRFASIDDVIFLIGDCVRGRQLAEDHRLALLTATMDDAVMPETAGTASADSCSQTGLSKPAGACCKQVDWNDVGACGATASERAEGFKDVFNAFSSQACSASLDPQSPYEYSVKPFSSWDTQLQQSEKNSYGSLESIGSFCKDKQAAYYEKGWDANGYTSDYECDRHLVEDLEKSLLDDEDGVVSDWELLSDKTNFAALDTSAGAARGNQFITSSLNNSMKSCYSPVSHDVKQSFFGENKTASQVASDALHQDKKLTYSGAGMWMDEFIDSNNNMVSKSNKLMGTDLQYTDELRQLRCEIAIMKDDHAMMLDSLISQLNDAKRQLQDTTLRKQEEKQLHLLALLGEKRELEDEICKISEELKHTAVCQQRVNNQVRALNQEIKEVNNEKERKMAVQGLIRDECSQLRMQLPAASSTCVVPFLGSSVSAAQKPSTSSACSIQARLAALFPNISRDLLMRCIDRVRKSNGNSLSGLRVHEIADAVRVVLQQHQHF